MDGFELSDDVWAAARNNEPDALSLVVKTHRGLVGKALKEIRLPAANWHLNREDLYQEGMIALIAAARGFDPSLGNTFSTYAMTAIERRLRRQVTNINRLIKLPALNKKRLPSAAHLAARKAASVWMHLSDCPESLLDSCLTYDPRKYSGPSQVDLEFLMEKARSAVDHIHPREAEFLHRRMQGETLENISLDHNITRERVRQVQVKGLLRVRQHLARELHDPDLLDTIRAQVLNYQLLEDHPPCRRASSHYWVPQRREFFWAVEKCVNCKLERGFDLMAHDPTRPAYRINDEWKFVRPVSEASIASTATD